ncbi:M20 family metallopeptidase [Croceivirga thetidis]|uniref:Amidohydrolase n=1 Tax=Croceivirga thetidis TaxID=2721623 RepID=A0ABX1GSJ3_9FLAO|nr:M20 family metallopeptidase [Croceivirga thetidis]NKI31890.1 amidohydrolase [Croceivirga thetidis]
MKKSFLTFAIIGLVSIVAQGQKDKSSALSKIDAKKETYTAIADKIWGFAEMGYQEVQSTALLQETLENEGFTITSGVANIPTAFVAEYGSGGPVIGILGEFDALPGLSQKAIPQKESAGGIGGHACGHHLFGTASTAAAITVKEWLKETNQMGTIRFYGCPAEEGGGAKVYMAREGLFDDVDIVLHWHPSSQNAASAAAALANISGKFRFNGVSAHAAGAPHMGRSALDGVEAMNHMVNMMREHVLQETRIHYVITDGGKAPNVVPDFAEVYYYARHNSRDVVRDVFDRIIKAAEGAAMGTGTTMEYEIVNGVHELLPNLVLQKVVHDNLSEIGGFTYTAEEREFAEKISQSLGQKELVEKRALEVQPFKETARAYGSTDVGDVSFVVPTVGFGTATWVPGTPAHSWQAVAAGGTSIGHKGMVVAAKTLTATAIDLFTNTDLIEQAKKEFEERRGVDFVYAPLLGDRPPALDYRK